MSSQVQGSRTAILSTDDRPRQVVFEPFGGEALVPVWSELPWA
jgi:hypothetical protein